MLLSIWPSAAQSWSDVEEVVAHADRTGWQAAYVADHFMGDGSDFGSVDTPMLEATATLSGLAAITHDIRLGSLVLGNTYRHPAVVANWAATLDHQSDGRAILGIGAGWQQNEHDQYGIRLPPPGERLRRFEEACAVLGELLRDPPADFDGVHYRLSAARCAPRPVQSRLPLLIGGKGDRMLGVVARHADHWNMWGTPERLSERAERLRRECEAIDRDPATIHRSTQALILVTDDKTKAEQFVSRAAPRAAFGGTAAQFADLCARYGAVGIDEVIVPDAALGRGERRLEQMNALREVIPR